MKNYYSNSQQYHDDLDRYEARVRAEQEEADAAQEEKCTCLDFAGDDEKCPVHGWMFEPDGSDNTMSSQLEAAGFGCSGVF